MTSVIFYHFNTFLFTMCDHTIPSLFKQLDIFSGSVKLVHVVWDLADDLSGAFLACFLDRFGESLKAWRKWPELSFDVSSHLLICWSLDFC